MTIVTIRVPLSTCGVTGSKGVRRKSKMSNLRPAHNDPPDLRAYAPPPRPRISIRYKKKSCRTMDSCPLLQRQCQRSRHRNFTSAVIFEKTSSRRTGKEAKRSSIWNSILILLAIFCFRRNHLDHPQEPLGEFDDPSDEPHGRRHPAVLAVGSKAALQRRTHLQSNRFRRVARKGHCS